MSAVAGFLCGFLAARNAGLTDKQDATENIFCNSKEDADKPKLFPDELGQRADKLTANYDIDAQEEPSRRVFVGSGFRQSLRTPLKVHPGIALAYLLLLEWRKDYFTLVTVSAKASHRKVRGLDGSRSTLNFVPAQLYTHWT